jgi:hypothetical protein
VVTLTGPKVAVTPVGSPETENVTGPVKPPAGATVIVSVADTGGVQNMKKQNGGVTVRLVDAGVSVKLPAEPAVTVSVTVVVSEKGGEVPVPATLPVTVIG